MSLVWGGSVFWESACSVLKAKQELSGQRGQCAQRLPRELRAAVCGPCQWEKWADQALVLMGLWEVQALLGKGPSRREEGAGGRCEPQQDVGEMVSARRRERVAPSRHHSEPPLPAGSAEGAGHTQRGQATRGDRHPRTQACALRVEAGPTAPPPGVCPWPSDSEGRVSSGRPYRTIGERTSGEDTGVPRSHVQDRAEARPLRAVCPSPAPARSSALRAAGLSTRDSPPGLALPRRPRVEVPAAPDKQGGPVAG